MTKETLVEKDVPKRIKHIQFGILSPQEIWEHAEIEVCNKDMYNSIAKGGGGARKPAPNGCLDPHLVSSSEISPAFNNLLISFSFIIGCFRQVF